MSEVSISDRWSDYLEAYGPIAKEQRRTLLEASVSEDLHYTNPNGEGHSRAELTEHIERLQARMPGTTFATERLLHSQEASLAVWCMRNAAGENVATGYNFIRQDEAGRINFLAGFY